MKKIINFCLLTAFLFSSFSAHAIWQCTVSNPVKGQTWIGFGATRVNAMERAIGLCSKNSVNVKNCHILGCFQR